MLTSLAALTGPPVSDALIELQGGYIGAQAFAWSVTLLGFAFLFTVKIMLINRTKAGWMVKI